MLGVVSFYGSFRFREIFYFVIHSDILASSRNPVFHRWTWIFKIWIHVCHHGPVFSILLPFWVLLRAIPGTCPLPWVLVILYPCYLFNQSFCYVLSVPISYSKIVLLPLHLVVGLFLLLGRFFFNYFGISRFVCIVWPSPAIFWVFLLSLISFDLFLQVSLSDMSAVLFCYSHINIHLLCSFSFTL